jgi:SAM-dependent methyltransferase
MNTTQKNIFLESEADRYYNRNEITGDRLEKNRVQDPLIKVLTDTNILPTKVLEIGASNGWRLALLKEYWPNCRFAGLDPSKEAIRHSFNGLEMHEGTAESLPFGDDSFDLVIFGFCLYLCDRKDLFRIASEADRVLQDHGHMVIYDFHVDTPYKNPYSHLNNIYSYKMDNGLLFSWSPAYQIVKEKMMPHSDRKDESIDNRIGVSVFQKNLDDGWPDGPIIPTNKS